MFYTVYQTTCLVNGKTYIGCHKTKDPNDSYLGSGVWLKKAILQHGVESFTKKVLFVFDNPQEMLDKEKELVVVDAKTSYNLVRGGQIGRGSWNEDTAKAVGTLAVESFHTALYRDPELKSLWKSKLKDGLLRYLENNPEHIEKYKECWIRHQKSAVVAALSSESREKRISSLREIAHQQGSTNSQYGTCWVTKEGQSLKIQKEDLESYLSRGFLQGRGSSFSEKMSKAVKDTQPEYDLSEALVLFETGLHLSEVSKHLNLTPRALRNRLLAQGLWNPDFSRKGRPSKRS